MCPAPQDQLSRFSHSPSQPHGNLWCRRGVCEEEVDEAIEYFGGELVSVENYRTMYVMRRVLVTRCHPARDRLRKDRRQTPKSKPTDLHAMARYSPTHR